jgi:serine/threonine-protein kinase
VSSADALGHLIGQTIDGKYRVEAPLGRGGMGAVFRAVHVGTDRIVAVKVITPSLASDPQYIERFRREARACGRLQHPNIVNVTDFGVTQHAGRQLAYLVMEFLDGCTLGDVLRQEPTPPVPWVIDTLEQTCAAVEEAHRHGILHRDLKPDNIWLEPNRRGSYSVKVLDFGLARLESGPAGPAAVGVTAVSPAPARDATATFVADVTMAPHETSDVQAPESSGGSSTTGFAGTPAYMSPEQARGGLVTPAADVYSLGVIAYRMLTGSEPFTGSVSEIIGAHIQTMPPDVRTLRPDVPADAATLIASALAKDPAARPASAGAFGNMLAAQLQPPGAFFQQVTMLFIERLRPLLTVSSLAFMPAMVFSFVLAAWTLAYALNATVPAPAGKAAYVMLAIFALLLLGGAFAVGVLPAVVLQALAAPMRPINLGHLRAVYEPRIRAWGRSMRPLVWPQLVMFLVLAINMEALDQFRPWVRSFPRIARIPLVLGLMSPTGLAIWWTVRRMRTGLTGGMFVGPAMLVEGLDFDAARQRSVDLSRRSGRLQQAVRQRFLILMLLSGALLGALIGRARLSTGAGMALAPLIAVASTLVMTVVGLVSSLLYFAARRATGEALDRVLDDFERTALPATHWQRAHRERVQDHLRTARGSRFEVASPPQTAPDLTRRTHASHLRGAQAQDDR